MQMKIFFFLLCEACLKIKCQISGKSTNFSGPAPVLYTYLGRHKNSYIGKDRSLEFNNFLTSISNPVELSLGYNFQYFR